MNKVDLVIILDISQSNNVWNQLQTYIENIVIDIHNKLIRKQNEYSQSHNTMDTDVLFRVSLITFCDDNDTAFDIFQGLDGYDFGNQKVLLNNLLYNIRDISIKNVNVTSTAQLKWALHIVTTHIFPENDRNDMLFTLLITDEVVTKETDMPCMDSEIVNAFQEYNAIFGAIFIDEHKNDTLLPLFRQSIDCFVHNYSIIETNSSVDPSQSFDSFYGFIDEIDMNNLNITTNACDAMVNISWPSDDFDVFVPRNECGIDMHLVFIIDLTPKYDGLDCFKCWIDSISSLIMSTFNMVHDSVVPFVYTSLHIAIVTFDGLDIHTYYNLNDTPINSYPQLSQILPLIQSLSPAFAFKIWYACIKKTITLMNYFKILYV